MALAKDHTFQVLTKRPERMLDYARHDRRDDWARAGDAIADKMEPQRYANISHCGNPGNLVSVFSRSHLPNVWLGVSVEDQATADKRIPLLLQTPAAVRWVSAEPLLGPVDLGLLGTIPASIAPNYTLTHERIDWVVVGGESGHHARPMHPAWARSLRDQCEAAGVPFLFKQWGEWVPHPPIPGGDEARDLRNGIVQYMIGDGREFDGHFRKGDAAVRRVGKKVAGRMLDGVQHDGYPGVQPQSSKDTKDLEFLLEMKERFKKGREGDSTQLEYVENMIDDWIAELKENL